MNQNPRLTSLDVRGNDSMTLDGAKALGKFMLALGKGVSHVPRSLCGVTPSNSTLNVPNAPSEVDLRLICAELSSHVFSEGISAGMGGKAKGTALNRRGASAANEWQPFLWAVKENRRDLVECEQRMPRHHTYHTPCLTPHLSSYPPSSPPPRPPTGLLDEFDADVNEQQGVSSSSNNYSALHICATKVRKPPSNAAPAAPCFPPHHHPLPPPTSASPVGPRGYGQVPHRARLQEGHERQAQQHAAQARRDQR